MRIIVAIIAVLGAVASATAEEIRYTLTPQVEHGALNGIAVEMVLTGEADGETAIELPDAWGGKSELWRGISEFRVSGKGLKLDTGGSPALKVLRHAPGATLTVRYRVTQTWPGEPAVSRSNEYRPVIKANYFHVIGWTMMARPKWSLATNVTVSFGGLPEGWQFASDLEHGSLTLADLLESVSVGGDFRVLKAGALRVAIRGTWAFSDADFVKRLQPIIASHHKFWGDQPTPFLVTVLPLQADVGSMSLGGTGLNDAFAFFATANVEGGQLTRILAHEHLHSWIPRRVGMMPQENNDSIEYWLSEGFTDFYTYRLLMREGLWSVEETAKAYNDVMWDYAFSPVRNAPNAKVAAEFWGDRAMNDLPYLRGLLFATLIDDRVRRLSSGSRDLDDVMLAMKRVVDAMGKGAIPPPIRGNFIALAKTAGGVDVQDDIARIIEKGETVVLPGDALAPCGLVETSMVAAFDRGFDGRKTIANNNIVTGVDPEGPAFAAGLRDGMRLLRLDLSEGRDSRVPLTYKVHADGKTREISYLPAGKRKVTLQELKLKPMSDEAVRKACAARFAGSG
jgi:predicted metalloprotease with PDZ domain